MSAWDIPHGRNPGVDRVASMEARIGASNPVAGMALGACRRMIEAAAKAEREGGTVRDVLLDHAAIMAALGERMEHHAAEMRRLAEQAREGEA